MSKARSGGGITSNKNVSTSTTPGKPTERIDTGRAITSRGPDGMQGNSPEQTRGVGPGAGRTVHPTGSQGKN